MGNTCFPLQQLHWKCRALQGSFGQPLQREGRPGEGASAFRPPRPCLGSGKREEACGISSPLVAATGSVTRTGVAATVVWTHTQGGGTRGLLGEFSAK